MRIVNAKQRKVLITASHLILVVTSFVGAFLLRFDFAIPAEEREGLFVGVLAAVPIKLLAFAIAKIDRGWWKYSGIADLRRILLANLGASLALAPVLYFLTAAHFPRSIYLVDALLCLFFTTGSRFAVRLYNEAHSREVHQDKRKRIMIYGAGQSGFMLLREILSASQLGYEVVGFIDDDPSKIGVPIMNVPVLGTGRALGRIVEAKGVDEIVIAMSSVSGSQMREVVSNCRAAGIPCKTIPSIRDLLGGEVLARQIREVSLEDLLGREPVRLDQERIRQKLAGRRILVTGAGGSIGSELCRQIARYQPQLLILLDQAESDLFRIDVELRQKFPGVPVVAEIGDIRDSRRMHGLVQRLRVESILHAAAYKHVPLLETHVFEAVRNNVIGTWNLLRAANKYGVADFLMISTDKAVNPTNILGLSKRVAELIATSKIPGLGGMTRSVCVRFGNVLGSNGSVVPTFRGQIAAGGPVTVTHPEVRRFFMTIPEAVQLVLQASAYGNGSEIFVLDMGELVRIADLARNMIRLAGLVPDEDIEIRFVGLRPGEKLYEELRTKDEDLMPTAHEKIKVLKGAGVSPAVMADWLPTLERLLEQGNEDALVRHLHALVPEYLPSRRWAVSETDIRSRQATVGSGAA